MAGSDASIHEILLKINQSLHFIIEDLDANHVFIDESKIDLVRAEVDKRLSENVYSPSIVIL